MSTPAIMAEPTETANGGLFYYLYQGVKLGIYPPLIFLGVGAMTDFGPLDCTPIQLFARSGGTARHFPDVFWAHWRWDLRRSNPVQLASSAARTGPTGDLCDEPAGSGIVGADRR